jgi:hypothetical protein
MAFFFLCIGTAGELNGRGYVNASAKIAAFASCVAGFVLAFRRARRRSGAVLGGNDV